VSLATLAILLPIGAHGRVHLRAIPVRGSRLLFSLFLGGMMFSALPDDRAALPAHGQLHLFDTLHGLVLVYVAYSLSFTCSY